LWATFGVNRITPFDENFTREQMKIWKMSSITKKAHEDLYHQINPDDENSDTYLSSIIKKVFVVGEEQTRKNAIWCQAILEIIFDENFLSSKLEADIIDKWYTKLLKVLVVFCFCGLLRVFSILSIFINCILIIVGR
jgi:hypothetical protein